MSRDDEKRSYGVGRVFKRPGSPNYYVAYMVNGEEKKESSKSTKRSVAVRLLQKRVAELQRGEFLPNKKTTVSNLIDLLFEDYSTNERKSLSEVEKRVERHVRPYFGRMVASRVTKSTIKAYKKFHQQQLRKGKPPSSATINRELAALQRAFNLGYEEEPKLVTRVPKIDKLPEPPPRKGFFEDDEFDRFHSYLPDAIKAVVTFAYWTSCRFAEILSLRWSQVDLDRGLVRFASDDTKNGEPRTVPLMAKLKATINFLHEQRQMHWPNSPWVFSRQGERIRDIRGAWDTASKAAGLWDKGTDRHTKLFHDFRRTAARNMRRAGLSQNTIMKIGGWKTDSVFRRYDITNEKDMEEAAERLTEFSNLQDERREERAEVVQ